VTQINALVRQGLNATSMALLSTFGREAPIQLNRRADQLDQLAALMSRPDGRIHIMERAAECRARAALIQAARASQR
jgi:hypothetical protein